MSAQKYITKEQGSEMKIKNPNASVELSMDMLKKLSVITISEIFYQRKIFPEISFSTKNLKGTPIKILRTVDEIPDVDVVINWLRSAFELVKAQHLRKLILVIDTEPGNVTLETYTLRYKYNQEEITCFTLEENNTSQVNLQISQSDDIIASAKSLVNQVYQLTDNMKPLPRDCVFSLRLELDEDTPENFKLPLFFKVADSLEINFPPGVEHYKLGSVTSRFTSVALAGKSVLFKDPISQRIYSSFKATSETEQSDDIVPSSQDLADIRFSLTKPQTPQVESKSHSNENTEENSGNCSLLSNQIASVSLQDKEIKCICESQKDLTSDFIECLSCLTLQHKACYMLLNNRRGSDFICVNCHDPEKNRYCPFYEVIVNEKKESAIYRKAIALCLQSTQVSHHKIMTRLGVTRNLAAEIIDQLESEGCICPSSGKSKSKIVRNDHIKENILNKYFNQENDNKSDDNMDIDLNSSCDNELNKSESRKRSYSKTDDEDAQEIITKRTRRVLKSKILNKAMEDQ